MRLKLFSGGTAVKTWVDDFNKLLNLDEGKIDLLVGGLVTNVTGELDREELAKELGVEKADDYLMCAMYAAGRILSGLDSAEVQEDLVTNGFPREKVARLFSALKKLSPRDKIEVRFFCLDVILEHRTCPNWDSISSESVLRPVIDNGQLIGVVPRLMLALVTGETDDRKEQRISLEMASDDLERFLGALESTRKQFAESIEEFKSRLGETIATRASE